MVSGVLSAPGLCWPCAAKARSPRLFSALGTTPHLSYSSWPLLKPICVRPACLMPLYYFHVRHEEGLVEDEEGIALPHAAAVYAEAMRSALEFVAEVEEPGRIQLEVIDGAGVLVLRASLQDLAAACGHQSTYLGSGA